MKRILITGGAGFVGSHLCERLLSEGNNVVCVDNYFTGNKQNISHLTDNPNFEIVEHDICDPLTHPQAENYWGNVNPIGIRSCYDEGKRCAETLFMDYHRQNRVRIKIARIFNTYGTRMQPNDGRVISNFIIQALQNKDITIYGNGQQTRSFQYVDDLIEGIIQLMATPDSFVSPVNIGNPEEFTILELAEKIIQLTNSKSEIVFLPAVQDDPQQRCPNISLAKEILDWQPKIQLEEGLKRTIEYFKM